MPQFDHPSGGVDGDEETFREKLRLFFQERGQQMPKVPNVGGSSMRLGMLFRIVNEDFGGCFAVTAERKWKLVVARFRFPPSCTSGSFVVRQTYERFLLDYEKSVYGSAHKYALATPPAPSPTVHRTVAASAVTAAPQASVPRPLSPPTPADRAGTVASGAAGAGVPEYAGLHRLGRSGCVQHLSYALQCGLPNEIDWAVNALVMLSADERPEKGARVLRDSPLLLEILVPMAARWLRGHAAYELEDAAGGVLGGRLEDMPVARAERGLAVMLALRNLSMWDDAAVLMARSRSFLALLGELVDGLCAGAETPFNVPEGRTDAAQRLAAECAVNVVRHLPLNDATRPFARKLIALTSWGLASSDRAHVVGALAALAALCEGDDGNADRLERLVPDSLSEAVARTLLVPDPRVAVPALETLYKCTLFSPAMARRMCGDARVVGDLVRLLLYDQGAFDCDAAIAPAGDAFGGVGNDEWAWECGASQADARRALVHWLQTNYEVDASAEPCGRIDMYARYVGDCAAAGVPHQNACAFAAAAHALFSSLTTTSTEEAEGWRHTYRGIREQPDGAVEWLMAWSDGAGDAQSPTAAPWSAPSSVEELTLAYAGADVGPVAASVRFTAALVLRNLAREPLCRRHVAEHAALLAAYACTHHPGAAALAECVGDLL